MHVHDISIHAPTRGATIQEILQKVDIHFNPRPYTRGDRVAEDTWTTEHISIHAPTRGATNIYFLYCQYKIISIHAPTRGATKPLEYIILSLNFNPRPYTRGDPIFIIVLLCTFISIHAPTRGATK